MANEEIESGTLMETEYNPNTLDLKCPVAKCDQSIRHGTMLSHILCHCVPVVEPTRIKRPVFRYNPSVMPIGENVCLGLMQLGDAMGMSWIAQCSADQQNENLPQAYKQCHSHLPVIVMARRMAWRDFCKITKESVPSSDFGEYVEILWLVAKIAKEPMRCTVKICDRKLRELSRGTIGVRQLDQPRNPENFVQECRLSHMSHMIMALNGCNDKLKLVLAIK